jgi:membrane protease YdiL (CAAX protease family)
MFGNKVESNTNQTIEQKRIFIFIAIAYGITVAAGFVTYLAGGMNSAFVPQTDLAGVLMLVIAFAPAIANIATRLITREGWSNTCLRPNLRRGWPFYLAACILPLTGILLGGTIYFLLFPDKFDLSMSVAREAGKISATASLVNIMGKEFFEGFLTVLFLIFVVLGEEFGWRAYLLQKLMPLGSRKALLLVGAIWGMWHWPMLLMGFQYGQGYWGAPIVGPLLFVLIILSPSIIYSWLTLRTRSVWPACTAHAVNNVFCGLMAYLVRGEPNALIGPGVEGIIGCLGYLLLALPLFLIPSLLAPVSMVLSKNPVVVDKAADQVKLGTVS